jgi:hypothetical protein
MMIFIVIPAAAFYGGIVVRRWPSDHDAETFLPHSLPCLPKL